MYDTTTLCVDYTTLGICMTSFALQKTAHPLYHIKLQSLRFHIHFRHDITLPVSDMHPLYLCHHTLSTDITPTFVWKHTHYMYYIICTIYNIISTDYVITLLYLWQQNLDIWTTPVCSSKYTLSMWHHSHSSVSSHSLFVWHHTHNILHHIDVVSVTTSPVLIPHQLYFWDLILYMWRHHIHCIQQHIHYIFSITATLPVSHTHAFHDITPFVYMTLHPLYV